MLISDLSSEQLLMLIIPALPNMWALKHAMYHDFPTTQEKYRWMMACVFVPCLAGVAYYFVGRKHASKEKVDIRARIEAERARAAEEKERAAEVAAQEDGDAVVSAVASDAASMEGRNTALSAEDARDEGRESSAGVADSRLEEAEPRVRKDRSGDEWSFGCPDDVRKPKA